MDNAWYKVYFGGCKYGIFSAACPIEPLYAIENGIIPDCIKILYHEYIKSSKDLAKHDDLVQQLTELPRQCLATAGSNPAMPRLLWKNGITNLSDLTASAKVGIMFTLLVVALTDKGEHFLQQHSKTTKSGEICWNVLR